MTILITSLVVATISWLLTYGALRFALKKNIIDEPNKRSSHNTVIPRGGGAAIVVSCLASLFVLSAIEGELARLSPLLVFPPIIIAAIGLLDDIRTLSPGIRLLGQFAASAFALALLPSVPQIEVIGLQVSSGWWGAGLGMLFLVWMLNLYNFMDGIDGIAAVEAITVSISLGLLSVWSEYHVPATILFILAASCVGFLYWNFPVARIFMGDVGSGFLGFLLGLIILLAATYDPILFWCGVILLGVFIVDATMTLGARLLRAQKIYEAHKTHAYQNASRRYESHRKVTLAIGVINLMWLLPIASLVLMGLLQGLEGVLLAYLPLVLGAIVYKAGRET